MSKPTTLACQCGQFRVELTGEPLLAAECHCNSCREAASRLARVPAAVSVTADNGGTPYVLYRKDRVRFPDGAGNLAAFTLTEKSHTRRHVSACCNTPIGVEFSGGHWISLYARLWPAGSRPRMDIRTQTGDVPAGTVLDTDLPSGFATTAGFYGRLLWAWAAMGFRSPKIDAGKNLEA